MSRGLLIVRGLSVRVREENILESLNLSIRPDETHVLMGPNGAGKSTLDNAPMGSPHYEMIDGPVEFQGQNLLDLPVNERAKAGIFMSFQNPLGVPGISLANFIRNTVEQRTGKRARLWNFRKEIAKALEVLNIDPSYTDHDLNVGFSGGEEKRAEILKLLILKPSLAILDETDSGLGVGAVRTVNRDVEEYQKDKDSALTITTHDMGILSSLKVGKAHVLVEELIVAYGDGSLVGEINRDDFAKFENEE